jgi:hypothetical protein
MREHETRNDFTLHGTRKQGNPQTVTASVIEQGSSIPKLDTDIVPWGALRRQALRASVITFDIVSNERIHM